MSQQPITTDGPPAAQEQRPRPTTGDRERPARRRARRRSRLIYLAVLALVGLIMLMLMPTGASTRTQQGGPTSTQSVPGGFNGGVSLAQNATATGKMYGGSGPNGSCLGTSGGIDKMLTFDFGWNQTALAHYVNAKWRGDTTDQLCNDHYTWDIAATMPAQNAVQLLQWPTDLLDPNFATRPVALRPIQSFDTRTIQAQAQQKPANQTSASNGNCISVPGGIDFGACLAAVGNAIGQLLSNAFHSFIDWATSFIPMFTTSPAITYDHGVVKSLWAWSLGVADAALALFLIIGGYNAMMRHSLGANYHTVLEFLPRILLAAVAANFSLTFVSSFIELNNALCLGVQGAIATAGAGNLSLPWGLLNFATWPFYAATVYLIEGFVAVLLVVQAVVRVALLDLLIILSPIWCLMLGLRQTERWGKLGAAAFGATCFLQFLQVLAVGMGSALVASFGHASQTPITILVGLASLYLAFKIPGMLMGAVLRAVESAGSGAADTAGRLAMLLAA
jgi:hypothetical protein